MATSPATPTPITPPRVPLIDSRTGLIDRAWYLFFLSIFQTAQTVEGTQPGPNAESLLASYDEALRTLAQATETTPTAGVTELAQEVSDLRQEVQTLPKPPFGTFAALQQANLPWTTFDTTPESVPSLTTGTLYWDSEDRSKTLALVMEDTGQIVQDIGEETFYRVKASATTTKGQVMMFTGTVGASGGIIAAPATGLTSTQSEYILGIATQDIALNGWGYVTWFGELKGVNTTGGAEAWVDGQILYYNPAVTGGLTKNVPTAPNPKVIVAAVVHAASNGILFVRPTFGSALGATDSNVEISSLANNDLLVYDSTDQRWENKNSITLTNLTVNGNAAIQTTTNTNYALALGKASGAGLFNIYASGTATNYFAGSVGIGISNPSVKLHAYVFDASTGKTELARFERFTTGDNQYLRILVDNATNAIEYDSTGTSSGSHDFLSGNVKRLSVGVAETVVNDPGNDYDFRVESNTNTHALFVEGTNSNVKIGGNAERGITIGANHLDIFNGTAPVGTLTNGISIYSSSGEAYVMDAAGNATLFSPHDAETNEWIFRSKHTPTGKVLRIDVERLLRFVNDHFGLDAVQEFIEESP